MTHSKITQHLQARYLDTSLHTVWVDDNAGVAIFPLWNLTGEMIGYQQYRPDGDKKSYNNPKDGKYYTHRKGKKIGVWGLESWSLSNTLFVTEGVFDAARFTGMGYSAIATLSNDVDDSLKSWLWVVKQARLVVAICDNDAAGRKLSKCGNTFHVVEEGKDVGEAPDSYIRMLIEKYC